MKDFNNMDGELITYDIVPANQSITKNYFDDNEFYDSDLSSADGNGEGEYETAGGGSWGNYDQSNADGDYGNGLGEYASDGGGSWGEENSLFEGEIEFEGSDAEYSELFGLSRKEREAAGKEGGFFKGVGEMISSASQKNKAGRQEKRATKTATKTAGRAQKTANKVARRDARQKLKLQKLDTKTKLKLAKAGQSNPEIKAIVQKMDEGTATPQEEQKFDAIVDAVNQDGAGIIDAGAALGFDLSEVKAVDDTQKQAEAKGWAKLPMGAKIGIIGGGALVLGLIVFMIVKSSSKTAVATPAIAK